MTADLAWAAGLFEGEGCFSEVRGGRTIHLALSLEMTDQEIVQRFYDILQSSGAVGGSRISTRWRGNVKHSRQYVVKITGAHAEKAYALLHPWLGSRRKARAEAILERRRASVDALVETRKCQGCEATFEVGARSTRRRWCSMACYQRVRSKTPQGRADANERGRRYRERKRIPAIGRNVAGAIPGTSPHAIR
jgi:hypothetical protein